MSTVTPHRLSTREVADIAAANRSGRPVVVFVHGLWLLSDSWDAWRRRFESHGYATVAPAWPGDPDGVQSARDAPDRLARNSLATLTAHYAGAINRLAIKPVVIGHSIGGLVAQQLADRALAGCTIAISPAPFRGIWRVPTSTARATWPVLRSPSNRRRAVGLTFAQFRYSFANAVDLRQAEYLYQTYVVPGAGRLVFEAAGANLNPRSNATVNTLSPHRGPLKFISGELDRMVPWSVASAAFRRQRANPAHTEFFESYRRGHSLTIDSAWQGVADTALRFADRFNSHA